MDKRLYDYTKVSGYKMSTFGKGIKVHYLNGKKLESPSKLLSPISKITLEKIPEAVLKAAIERGSAISNAVETLVEDKQWPDIDAKYISIFKQFGLFLKETGIKPLQAEYFVLNEKLNYCGFVDLICEDEKGKLIAIEIKTRDITKYPLAKDINHLQNNFYKMIIPEIPFYILSLDSKGREWKMEELKDMKQDALDIHKYYNKYIKPELNNPAYKKRDK